MAATYRIPDEPAPGRLAYLTVNPFWPLIASMLGGTWLGWPWFIANAWLVGSATRVKELGITLLGLVGSIGIAAGILVVASHDSGWWVKYVALVLVFWKLGISYWVSLHQGRSFALYEYFAGRVSQGAVPVILGFVLRGKLVGLLAEASDLRTFLILVLL